jgi:hypothetical protein
MGLWHFGMGYWYGRWIGAYLFGTLLLGLYRDSAGIRHAGMGMCIEAVIRLFSWQWHSASGPGGYAYGFRA